MYLSNIETIPGKTILSSHGIVSGSTVRAKHVGRDIMAGVKNVFGGELKGYTELLVEARRQAMETHVLESASPIRLHSRAC